MPRLLLLLLLCIHGTEQQAAALLPRGTVFAAQNPFRLTVNQPRRAFCTRQQTALSMGPRYGPPSEEGASGLEAGASLGLTEKVQYQILIDSIISVKDPQHIPSLLAKNMDLLLILTGNEGVALAQSIIDETKSEGDDQKALLVEEAIDLTLSFAEEFVQQASKMDQQNKDLLGKILRTMSEKERTSREREESLDELFALEREKLTAGFLRHVEGECDRIASAPKMTPDSARLLETLRVIQARVVEELGEDLGEAAQVLGQLIGYETTSERLAVLEAGLTVRGVSFAHELKALTEEALEGFERVAGKADPELVGIIKEIDNSLMQYVEDSSEFE